MLVDFLTQEPCGMGTPSEVALQNTSLATFIWLTGSGLVFSPPPHVEDEPNIIWRKHLLHLSKF